MTLGKLLRNLRDVGDKFSTYEIPLVDEKEEKVDFDLDIIKDEKGTWCVQITRKGYEQAEKDLALTWEDMREIIRIDIEMIDDPEAHPEWMEEQPFYEEVLKRFKEARK